jgi:hypothetical protein
MKDLPASHYVQIYRRRVRIAEKQEPAPPAKALTQMKKLLVGLESLDPAAAVRLSHPSGRVDFIAVEDDRVVGSLEYLDTAP